MTIGQRIAQKRKELSLSQEDLGERLGVSRQAIYKWESDQTLPEVEKLVRLSQLFSVTVGWLLGVEENPSPQTGLTKTSDDSRELTPRQIQMVEDIAGRYIAAMPQPEVVQIDSIPLEPPKRRRWSAVLACAVLVILAGALVLTAAKLGTLSDRHAELQNEMHGLQNEMDALNSQLESLLESGDPPLDTNPSQAETPLLSPSPGTDWDVTITEIDYPGETVTFDIWMRPSAEADNLNCQLIVMLDGEDSAYPFEPIAGGLTARVTVPKADHIELSVLFYGADRSELYPLTKYSYANLVKLTLPYVYLREDRGLLSGIKGNTVPAKTVQVRELNLSDLTAEITQIRVGLFRDRELVMWYEKSENADSITSWDRPEMTLERGHIYCEAVVVTDEYGRERVFAGAYLGFRSGADQWYFVDNSDDVDYSQDPQNWIY